MDKSFTVTAKTLEKRVREAPLVRIRLDPRTADIVPLKPCSRQSARVFTRLARSNSPPGASVRELDAVSAGSASLTSVRYVTENIWSMVLRAVSGEVSHAPSTVYFC